MRSYAEIRQEAEYRRRHPRFTERQSHQCVWPLWDMDTPLEKKRCCGAAVEPGATIQYCAEHLEKQASRGTPSERGAVRAAQRLISNGA